jgi:uncharacterized protein YjgD (DUF1641 family)
MAAPLTFKPLPVDHKKELARRLEAAPVEHGEALLVLWDLLQTAHDQGILDLLDGMVSAKDTIAITIAKYAKTPEGIAAVRNLLATVKLLGQLDPEILDSLSSVLANATAEHQAERNPPSLWQLFRRSTSADSRRGLSFLTLLLSGLGKSLK